MLGPGLASAFQPGLPASFFPCLLLPDGLSILPPSELRVGISSFNKEKGSCSSLLPMQDFKQTSFLSLICFLLWDCSVTGTQLLGS